MLGDDCFYIGRAAVTYLDGVSINYLMEWVVCWEALIYQSEKFLAYIGLYTFAKWWIVPSYFPFSVSAPSCVRCSIIVIPTKFQQLCVSAIV